MNITTAATAAATVTATATAPAPVTAAVTPAVVIPESELAPLLAAWDHAHCAATDDPEWRHLLDEMAHPRTTQAFYALAAARA